VTEVENDNSALDPKDPDDGSGIAEPGGVAVVFDGLSQSSADDNSALEAAAMVDAQDTAGMFSFNSFYAQTLSISTI
jgi:hypothetical protein